MIPLIVSPPLPMTVLILSGSIWIISIFGAYGLNSFFKVAGTKDGITALQMDIKIQGITEQILSEALTQAKQARAFTDDCFDLIWIDLDHFDLRCVWA
jgi:hypothetical protein